VGVKGLRYGQLTRAAAIHHARDVSVVHQRYLAIVSIRCTTTILRSSTDFSGFPYPIVIPRPVTPQRSNLASMRHRLDRTDRRVFTLECGFAAKQPAICTL